MITGLFAFTIQKCVTLNSGNKTGTKKGKQRRLLSVISFDGSRGRPVSVFAKLPGFAKIQTCLDSGSMFEADSQNGQLYRYSHHFPAWIVPTQT